MILFHLHQPCGDTGSKHAEWWVTGKTQITIMARNMMEQNLSWTWAVKKMYKSELPKGVNTKEAAQHFGAVTESLVAPV